MLYHKSDIAKETLMRLSTLLLCVAIALFCLFSAGCGSREVQENTLHTKINTHIC